MHAIEVVPAVRVMGGQGIIHDNNTSAPGLQAGIRSLRHVPCPRHRVRALSRCGHLAKESMMNDPLTPTVHRMVEATIGETPRVFGGPRCGMISAGVGVPSGVTRRPVDGASGTDPTFFTLLSQACLGSKVSSARKVLQP